LGYVVICLSIISVYMLYRVSVLIKKRMVQKGESSTTDALTPVTEM